MQFEGNGRVQFGYNGRVQFGYNGRVQLILVSMYGLSDRHRTCN